MKRVGGSEFSARLTREGACPTLRALARMSDSPDPPEDVARYDQPGTGLGHWIAAALLRLGGWTIGDPPPRLDKYVVIAAPHTDWWDGFWMLCFAWWWGLRINWLAKKSVMRWPVAGFLRWTGVVPVDRSAPQGLVGQIVEEFARRDRMVLSIPPEGTRGRREYWKSGFYHMAREAQVPVCMSYLDYGRRTSGFGPCIELSGDVGEDMDRIREFYADIKGEGAREVHSAAAAGGGGRRRAGEGR